MRSGHRYNIIKLGWGFDVQEAICPSSLTSSEGGSWPGMLMGGLALCRHHLNAAWVGTDVSTVWTHLSSLGPEIQYRFCLAERGWVFQADGRMQAKKYTGL